MQRIILVAALAAAMIIDGFFALVNFYPVAPHRARSARRYVVAELDAEQAAWFQHNMLDEFNEAHNTDLQLRTVEDESLLSTLADSRRHANDVILAAAPIEFAAEAMHQHIVRPFDEVVPAARIASDLSDVRHEVLDVARIGGRQWFLPRATVLDVAVYRLSKVRDAEEHWTLLRSHIDAALRAVNGRGLPAGYELKQSPSEWDSYDLFVLAYYWAHRSYDGHPARARVAHRTGDGIDAQLDYASAIYRMGGTDATFVHPDAPASVDYFAWEALYRSEGLYAPEMFGDDGLDDEGILDALANGNLYLTTLDQVEAFSVHGAAHRGSVSQISEPEDLGFVAMPRSTTLELDAHGHPARSGASFSFREESVWMLPAGAPDAPLAYELVKWVLARENHIRECEALGILPIREDVIRERASIFRLGWMSDVFDAAFVQWPRSEPVPDALLAREGPTYAALWSHLIGEGTVAPTSRDALIAALRSPPPPAPPEPASPATPEPPAHAEATDEHAQANESSVDPGAWRQHVVIEWPDAQSNAADARAE